MAVVWVREQLIDGVYVDDYVDDYSSAPKSNDYDNYGEYEDAYSNWIGGMFRDNTIREGN